MFLQMTIIYKGKKLQRESRSQIYMPDRFLPKLEQASMVSAIIIIINNANSCKILTRVSERTHGPRTLKLFVIH